MAEYSADLPDFKLGSELYELLDLPVDWIHRRVESLSFLDAGSVRRHVSLDFDLSHSPVSALSLVPFALLDKRPLIGLDVRDEGGAALPVLTKRENSFLAWSVVSARAERILADGLPAAVSDDLRRIVSESIDVAASLLEEFDREGQPERRARIQLMEDRAFRGLLATLATNFMLVVPLEDSGRRRVLKFSYIDGFDPPDRVFDRFMNKLGWTPTILEIPFPTVGESGSYHVEITAPRELEFDEVQLAIFRGEEVEEVEEAQIAGHTAHVYNAGAHPSSTGVATIWLKQPRQGLLRMAVGSAFVTAAVLTFYSYVGLDEIQRGPTASLLLSLPGLISVIVARPAEHDLAAYFFFGARVIVAISGLLSYAGAVLLTIRPLPPSAPAAWGILVFLSWTCFIMLVVSYFSVEPLLEGVDYLRRRFLGKETHE